MLPLLLCFQIESSEASEVLLADGLVDGGAAADALAVVVRRVRPPVRLHLDVAEDHVLDRCGEAGHLMEDLEAEIVKLSKVTRRNKKETLYLYMYIYPAHT